MNDVPAIFNILIIDDEPLIRSTLKAFLEDSGHSCMEAGEGMEGLEAFTRCRPDIVLTDLRMPGLDGCGVIAALSLQSPETPVIVVSGARDPLLAQQLLRLGVRAFLQKPIDLREVEMSIKSCLTVNPQGVES